MNNERSNYEFEFIIGNPRLESEYSLCRKSKSRDDYHQLFHFSDVADGKICQHTSRDASRRYESRYRGVLFLTLAFFFEI